MKKVIVSIGALVLFFSSLQAGNFRINKKASEIRVESKATPPHTVKSFVRDYSADIQLDTKTLAVSKAEFSFKLKDFDSAHEKRDKKMYSWIESDRFPEIAFKLTNIIEVNGQTIGEGSLTMHGVSKEIEVPFSIIRKGDTLLLDGSAGFSYEDWNLEIIRLFLFRVRPDLKVTFHLEGTAVGE